MSPLLTVMTTFPRGQASRLSLSLNRALARSLPDLRLNPAAVLGREAQFLPEDFEQFPLVFGDRSFLERLLRDGTVDSGPILEDLLHDLGLDAFLFLLRDAQVLPELLYEEPFGRRDPAVLPGGHDGPRVVLEALHPIIHGALAAVVNPLERFQVQHVDIHRLPHDVGEGQVDGRRAVDLVEAHLLHRAGDLHGHADSRQPLFDAHRALPPPRGEVVREHALLLAFDVRLRLGEEAVTNHLIEVPRQVFPLDARRERDRFLCERLRQHVPLLHVPKIGEVQEDPVFRRHRERRILLHDSGTSGGTDNPSRDRFTHPGATFLRSLPVPGNGDALPPGPGCAGPVRGDLRRAPAGGDRERLVHPVSRREAPLRQSALPDPRALGLHDEDRPDDRPGGDGRIVSAGGLRRPIRVSEGLCRPARAAGTWRYADPRCPGSVGRPFDGGYRQLPVTARPRDAARARAGRGGRWPNRGADPRAGLGYVARGRRGRILPEAARSRRP